MFGAKENANATSQVRWFRMEVLYEVNGFAVFQWTTKRCDVLVWVGGCVQ